MPAELFRNRPAALVNSAYTAGDPTLTVDDASDFPTQGDFRILLGNASGTILKVTAVSGNVFTVTAEAFDANAAVNDTVKIVASRAVAERFLQAPQSNEIRAIAGVSAADFYGPIYKLFDPTLPSWAWVNQGGATVVEANGLVYLTAPSSGSNSARVRKVAAPATPYTVTALVRERYQNLAANTQTAGLAFRDASGKMYRWYLSSAGQLQAIKWTNETTFSAIGAFNGSLAGVGTWHWMQMKDDGTNLKFLASLDGINFREYGSESRTAFFASGPTEIGIFADDQSSLTCSLHLASWLVN